MSDFISRDSEQTTTKQHDSANDYERAQESREHADNARSLLSSANSLLGASRSRGSARARGATLQAMQRTHGNRAVQRSITSTTFVQRSGPFDWMFPDQAYDTPTSEEIRQAEKIAQEAGYGLPSSRPSPPSSQVPTVEAPTVEAPTVQPPTVEAPTVPRPTAPIDVPEPVTPRLPTSPTPTGPVEPIPPTLRSPTPAVQPTPTPTPEIPVIEPGAPGPAAPTPSAPAPVAEPVGPGTLRSPGTPAPSGGVLNTILQNPAVKAGLRYGGGALGTVLGGLGVYAGGSEVAAAADDGGDLSDIGSILHGGLTMGAGGASMIGGIGTLLGGTAASTGALGGAVMLGKAGMVLGAGLLGYQAGRWLDQGTDWVGQQVSETGVGEALGMDRGGDYGISALAGKGAFAVDKAIGSLWGDESKAYNPETDEPTKVDRSYENTFAYKINQWLDD